MKVCVQATISAHSRTLQLSRPFFALKASPCRFQSSGNFVGKDYASLLLVRVQRRCVKPVFFLNGDVGDGKNHAYEWHAMDTSHVKLLAWGVLKRWGPPAAVGAMVGSVVARKALVFVVSFFFVMLMAVHKAMEAQGVHLNKISDVFSMHVLTNFLTTMKLILSTVFLYISAAIMACISRSSMYICHLLVPMRSFVANKQSLMRNLLTSNLKQPRETTTDSTLGSNSRSAETLMTDINACIRNVDGMMMAGKDMITDTKWNELKDSLALLKAKVASSSKGDRYVILSTDVSGSPSPAKKVLVKRPKTSAPVKSKGNIPQQIDVDKMQAARVDNILALTSVNAAVKEDAMFELTGGHEAAAPSEAALDQLLKEINGTDVSDAQPLDVAIVKIGKHESRSLRPKYIDYWTEQDPNESASSLDVEQGKDKELGTNVHFQRKGLIQQASQVMLREGRSKAQSADLDRTILYVGERASGVNNEVRSRNAANISDIIIRDNDGNGSKEHASSVDNTTAPDLTNDDIKETRWTNLKDKAKLNGSPNSTLDANVKKYLGSEQGTTLLGSTKELAFVREDAGLHVLTGSSRRVNDKELQRLMTDGETALQHGKAGLFGEIEVGEAETMLYKAADHFASAAALDLSCVEAVGLWGNTLLIHGELKLMLSRELRHLISTPDVISPYWIRQNKGMEACERSNRAALQRTFQTVCEECEELLVQAGRKYRRVLSISNSEVRALYNWGLALCFRAQLISEEGGQDAREAADRIYLAAIDKFEAIMGISQRYAPGAMLNWGLTLKERSRLRPSDSAGRINLLQQAKQLFIDALRMQPDDAQIHNAFVTCSVELREIVERQESRSRRGTKPFFGK